MEPGNRFLIFAARLLAIVGLFALFGVYCGHAHAADKTCYDCLTRAGDWSATKAKGDIIVCQPAGWKWGKAEADPKRYKVVRFCDLTKAEAEALGAHKTDKDGNPTNELKFKAFTAMDVPLIVNKSTDQVVTATDAKAAVKADSMETLALPGGVK